MTDRRPGGEEVSSTDHHEQSEGSKASAWAAFVRTSVRLTVPGEPVLAGEDAVDEMPLPPPVHVLTAWNPAAECRSPTENLAANEELAQRLRDLGTDPVPALGWLNEWSEPSFAVSGLTRDQAAQLGAEFGQLAIFELSGDELLLVDCTDATVRHRRPRQEPQG